MHGAWWWVDRWRCSRAYTDLSGAEQGLHRALVDALILSTRRINEFHTTSLSSDPATLRFITNCIEGEWLRAWPKVKQFWRIEGDRLFPGHEIFTYVQPCRDPAIETTHRRHIPLEIRRIVFLRDQQCRFCGAIQPLELDHIIPYRDGGPDTEENLRVLCKPCNMERG